MRHSAFDIDVNLFYIPSNIMMEKYDNGEWVEEEVNSKDFIEKNERDDYRISTKSDNAFFHFRDDDIFMEDFFEVILNWPEAKGPSFDKFKESLINGDKLSLITARGQSPFVIKTALVLFIKTTKLDGTEDWSELEGRVKDLIDNIDVYPVSSDEFNKKFGTDNEEYKVSYKKKLAFKDFLNKNYDNEPISIGFSDDDPKNIESIQELIEDELTDDCPKCHFVLYDTSGGEVKKYLLTDKVEKHE